MEKDEYVKKYLFLTVLHTWMTFVIGPENLFKV